MREVVLILVSLCLLSFGLAKQFVDPQIEYVPDYKLTGNSVVDHYETIVNDYSTNIHGILEEIQVQMRYLIASIYNETEGKVDNPDAHLADLGGGDCINADKLSTMLGKPIWCIEPYMQVNTTELSPTTHFIKIDAQRFSRLPGVRYNFGIMKEVIHHIPIENYKEMFYGFRRQLLPNGALVIMTRPPTPYFLFSKFLKERWANTSMSIDRILPPLRENDYHVSVQSHNFSMPMKKKDWKKFVSDRVWSTFSTVSDDDLKREFKQLDKAYPGETFNYTDNYIFIIAQKL
jgi:hypothetical protein